MSRRVKVNVAFKVLCWQLFSFASLPKLMGRGRDGLSTAGLLSLFLGQKEKVAQKSNQERAQNCKNETKRCPPPLVFPCHVIVVVIIRVQTLVPSQCQLNLNQAIDSYICSVLSGVHKYPVVGNSQSPVHPCLSAFPRFALL